ncbi:MAG: DUF448 domain-containing protein [Candidatus Limnocylindria bacterium]
MRSSDGSVRRDGTGRAPGRGTYLCHEPACRDLERSAAAIQRALGAEVVPGMLEVEVNDATT